jgi:hypothetical protein
MSNKKETAVEWLAEGLELAYQIEEIALRNFSIKKLINEAKEMEKQQIIDAYWDGGQNNYMTKNRCEQYYSETYEK